MGAGAAAGGCNDVLDIAEIWMKQGRDLAIATIVEARGAATGLVGRRMLVDVQGASWGALGHDAAEAAARSQAAEIIASGEPRLLDFALPGGHARLYLERLG